MADIVADLGARTLTAFGRHYPLAFGRNGAVRACDKREGDGKTPLGCFPLVAALLRPGRVREVPTLLPWRWLRPSDGWSDSPDDPAYNRPVAHPHPFSAERLWRKDHLYDIILVLGYNLNPAVPGRGSAIFWHVARPGLRPTAGCIAIPRAGLAELLPVLAVDMAVDIRAG